jgi:GDPmannose 4,6-dehydratase
MTKILITGAAGFVASYLVDHCLKEGDEVIGTVRWNEDLSRLNPKIEVEQMELTDLSAVTRVINKHRPDVIAHLAAQSWVPYSFQNPIYTIESNTIGTLNILEAVRLIQDIQRDCECSKEYNPLIHVCSSSEFYGKVPKEKQPITENHPASPMNPYGVGKVGADFISQLYKEYYGMRVLITRMFTHTAGRRTMMSAENYYAKYIAEIEAGKRDKVIPLGNMKSIRTWRDARDAITDYYKLYKEGKTGIYNISGDTTKDIQEVLDYMLSISTLNKDEIKFFTDETLLRKVDVDVQLADISKFKNTIEQTKDYTFEETMIDLLNAWRRRVK